MPLRVYAPIQGFTKDAAEAASMPEPFQKEQRPILTLAEHKGIDYVVSEALLACLEALPRTILFLMLSQTTNTVVSL